MSVARLGHKPSAEAPPQERIEAPMDSIRAWLGVLVRLLRLPAGEAADIRDELEGHLRERTRDLMVGGMDEDAAVRSAIAELGEAAEVAARFRSARTTARRRFLMNASILGVAATALVVSVVSFIQPGGAGPKAAVFTPPAPSSEIAGARAKAEFKEARLADVLSFLAQQAGKPLIVDWKSLDGVCPGADSPVTLSLVSANVPEILSQVSNRLELEGHSRLDVRVIDGALHIGTVRHFDKVETRLVAYDLSGVMEKGVDAGELSHVITSLVEPDGWAENGGDMARGFGIGDRLFIEAPARYHVRIAWIIGQLQDGAPGTASAPSPLDRTEKLVGSSPVVVYLNHADATGVITYLTKTFPGGHFTADPGTNSVILGDMPSRDAVQRVIEEMDAAPR